MAKVVKEVSVRLRQNRARVIGFSSSDRGSKFVNGVIEIDLSGKTNSELKLELAKAVDTLLEPQLISG